MFWRRLKSPSLVEKIPLCRSTTVFIYFHFMYLYFAGFMPSPEEFVDFYHETKGIGK